jgi:hypothetical protein
MLAFQARAMRAGLSKVGEPSLLGGISCGNVVIERGVVLETGAPGAAGDNYVGRYDTALIDVAYNPVVGAALAHPDGNYTLDRLVGDNGVTRSFIVVPA